MCVLFVPCYSFSWRVAQDFVLKGAAVHPEARLLPTPLAKVTQMLARPPGATCDDKMAMLSKCRADCSDEMTKPY